MILDNINFHAVRERESLRNGKVKCGSRPGWRRLLAPGLLRFEFGRIGVDYLDGGIGVLETAGHVVEYLFPRDGVNHGTLITAEVRFTGFFYRSDRSVLVTLNVLGKVAWIPSVLVVVIQRVSNAAEA